MNHWFQTLGNGIMTYNCYCGNIPIYTHKPTSKVYNRQRLMPHYSVKIVNKFEFKEMLISLNLNILCT